MFNESMFKGTIKKIVDKNVSNVFPCTPPDYEKVSGKIVRVVESGIRKIAEVRLFSVRTGGNFFFEIDTTEDEDSTDKNERMSCNYTFLDKNIFCKLLEARKTGKRFAKKENFDPALLIMKCWHDIVFTEYENIKKQVFLVEMVFNVDVIREENTGELVLEEDVKCLMI